MTLAQARETFRDRRDNKSAGKYLTAAVLAMADDEAGDDEVFNVIGEVIEYLEK